MAEKKIMHLYINSDRNPMDLRLCVLVLIAALSAMLIPPIPSVYSQGWWWGSPIDPSFDRNNMVELTGIASQVTIRSTVGPSTLRLRTADESFTVLLGPGWYLFQAGADIRNGDTLSVEGAKMQDRHGQVYLVASRLTNHRTKNVLELRDNAGWPRWKQRK